MAPRIPASMGFVRSTNNAAPTLFERVQTIGFGLNGDSTWRGHAWFARPTHTLCVYIYSEVIKGCGHGKSLGNRW